MKNKLLILCSLVLALASIHLKSGGRFHWFQGGAHQNSPDGNACGGITLMSLDQQEVHFGTRLGQFLRLYEDRVIG